MLAMAVITAGVLTMVAGPGTAPAPGTGAVGPAVAFGLAAAVCFAAVLVAVGEVSRAAPAVLTALPGRLLGVTVVAFALAARRPLWGPPRAVAVAAGAGVLEVAGVLLFALGAREGTAVTAVVASQYAALTVLGGFVLFGERLTARQLTAVALIGLGVAGAAASA